MKQIQVKRILEKIKEKLMDFVGTLVKPFQYVSENGNHGFIVRTFMFGFIVIMYFLALFLIFGVTMMIIQIGIPLLLKISPTLFWVLVVFFIPGLVVELIRRWGRKKVDGEFNQNVRNK